MPRIDKCGQRIGFEAPRDGSEGDNEVRYIGIDVGKEQHAIAVMDDSGEVVLKPKKFAEDIDGYERLRRWVGEPEEARGAPWRARGGPRRNLGPRNLRL